MLNCATEPSFMHIYYIVLYICIYTFEDQGIGIQTYFACSTSAATPDTSGADALVPVKSSVQSPFSVVVVYVSVSLLV